MNPDRVYYSHDAEVNALRKRTALIIAFLTVGMGIGATLALLFAPASGRNTRHDLVKTVEDGLQSGRDTVEPVVKRVEKELGEFRKNVDEHLNLS